MICDECFTKKRNETECPVCVYHASSGPWNERRHVYPLSNIKWILRDMADFLKDNKIVKKAKKPNK
jgi:hypothetical protein